MQPGKKIYEGQRLAEYDSSVCWAEESDGMSGLVAMLRTVSVATHSYAGCCLIHPSSDRMYEIDIVKLAIKVTRQGLSVAQLII
jgi:hypothetical protein